MTPIGRDRDDGSELSKRIRTLDTKWLLQLQGGFSEKSTLPLVLVRVWVRVRHKHLQRLFSRFRLFVHCQTSSSSEQSQQNKR